MNWFWSPTELTNKWDSFKKSKYVLKVPEQVGFWSHGGVWGLIWVEDKSMSQIWKQQKCFRMKGNTPLTATQDWSILLQVYCICISKWLLTWCSLVLARSRKKSLNNHESEMLLNCKKSFTKWDCLIKTASSGKPFPDKVYTQSSTFNTHFLGESYRILNNSFSYNLDPYLPQHIFPKSPCSVCKAKDRWTSISEKQCRSDGPRVEYRWSDTVFSFHNGWLFSSWNHLHLHG